MNGKCGLNWKYGLNCGENTEDVYIIKDGLIMSGFSFVTATSGSGTYGTNSGAFYITTSTGFWGGYINIGDVSGYTKLKMIMKCNKTDIYDGLTYHNAENIFNIATYDLRQVNLTNSYVEYELDISTFRGKSCINLFVNVGTLYCTDLWLE